MLAGEGVYIEAHLVFLEFDLGAGLNSKKTMGVLRPMCMEFSTHKILKVQVVEPFYRNRTLEINLEEVAVQIF